ncbi:MAG TPA: MBL fold metallo-hydrolase [Candidatus Acidoferrales bacterium]|nr:MBL fold metallo-hydrolase [Candidatus Acidoferrales bacterium]
MLRRGTVFFIVMSVARIAGAQQHRVQSIDVKVLSTMLADNDGIGEWGFSALVVADGHRILFDTGARPDTVLNNSRDLKIDLTNVPDVILSHNHGDHTGGLTTLRRAVRDKNPAALAVTHVGEGIFLRRDGPMRGWEPMDRVRTAYEALGGKIVVHDKPLELYPGVWLTGPVSRVYPEKNFGIGPGALVRMPDGSSVEDTIPEDMSLVFDTGRGLVVLSGCGHAGIVNTLQYARAKIRSAPVYAVIGGLHLFQLDDERLSWTAGKLREFGVQNFLGAHCTGIEATYRIRELCGLSRKTAAVAAVGGGFTLEDGIHPGNISR